MSSPNDSSAKAKCDQNQNPLVEDYLSSDDESYENIEKPSSTSRNSGKSILAGNQQFQDSIHSLNMWIWQCQTWTYFHGVLQTRLQQQNQLQFQSNNQNFHDHQPRRFFQSNNGIIMKLPTIKKRLLASFIDYFFIHFIYDQFRMLVTEVWDYDIPFNSMDFKELETYFPEDDDGLEDLVTKVFWIYVKTIQYAALFYLFYLIYETMFLYGFPNRNYPGSTIGKRILGLRVISCDHLEQISLVDNFLVRVQPGGNITFINRDKEIPLGFPSCCAMIRTLFRAFLRTLVKLMPISNTIQCINILTSRFNRSYFDKKMGCLVVDVSAQAADSIALAVAAASRSNNNNNTNNNNSNNNRNNQNNLNNQGVNNHNLQQQQQQQQQRPALNRGFW